VHDQFQAIMSNVAVNQNEWNAVVQDDRLVKLIRCNHVRIRLDASLKNAPLPGCSIDDALMQFVAWYTWMRSHSSSTSLIRCRLTVSCMTDQSTGFRSGLFNGQSVDGMLLAVSFENKFIFACENHLYQHQNWYQILSYWSSHRKVKEVELRPVFFW